MTTKQREAIEAHGRNLLAIFPRATVRNPVTLCKALRRHEARLHRIAELACNDAAYCSQPEEVREAEIDSIMAKVNALLGNDSGAVPVFFNRDPRGRALKIESEWMDARLTREAYMAEAPITKLRKDFGGFGLIAPEIGQEG